MIILIFFRMICQSHFSRIYALHYFRDLIWKCHGHSLLYFILLLVSHHIARKALITRCVRIFLAIFFDKSFAICFILRRLNIIVDDTGTILLAGVSFTALHEHFTLAIEMGHELQDCQRLYRRITRYINCRIAIAVSRAD